MIQLTETWKETVPDVLDQPIQYILVGNAHCTEETEEAEETYEIEEIDVGGRELWEEFEKIIDNHALSTNHTSNRVLFGLARHLRGFEKKYECRLGPTLLVEILESWKRKNESFLRPNHDYFCEFLVKLQAVQFAWGETLSAALERARQQSPPSRVLVLTDEAAHLLASLCRELQREAGDEPFYLIGRAAALLLNRSHSTVASWLRAFQALGILEVISKGYRGHGTRYRYIAED